MKQFIRNVTWRFQDSSRKYPQLAAIDGAIREPADVFRMFSFLFKGQVRERFLVIWLNATNRVTGFEIVTEGTLTSSLVHPREVFRGAIVATCASIIIAHNHPSGNSAPSAEDIQITKQLAEAGRLLGIPIHDHILFTDTKYTSFAEQGHLK